MLWNSNLRARFLTLRCSPATAVAKCPLPLGSDQVALIAHIGDILYNQNISMKTLTKIITILVSIYAATSCFAGSWSRTTTNTFQSYTGISIPSACTISSWAVNAELWVSIGGGIVVQHIYDHGNGGVSDTKTNQPAATYVVVHSAGGGSAHTDFSW